MLYQVRALADPSLWLCNRTNVALKTLLTSKVLGDVLRAVSSLEMFTLIAPHVCERMVAEGAVPSADLTHVNLNDHTVEGIRCRDVPAFSVQYHPEAGPGPHDSRYLFDEFDQLMARCQGTVA